MNATEPIAFRDAWSDLEIVDMAPGAARAYPLSYDWPSVTPDSRYAILRCEFPEGSGQPDGAYRYDVRTGELLPLGPCAVHPRLTVDGRSLLSLRPDSTQVWRIEIATGDAEPVADLAPLLPDGCQYVQLRLCPLTHHLYVMLRKPDITPIRVDLTTGEVVRLDIDGMVWACAVDEPRLIVVRMSGAEAGRTYDYTGYRQMGGGAVRSLWSLDVDGGDARQICVDEYSHATMLGRTASVQGCGRWGDRTITVCAEGQPKRHVCEGPYFWHSGASFDAEWIAADTNWPDYGIQLIHVPTGNFGYLCSSGSSLSTGLTHAHPGLSYDGGIVLFRSDRSGPIHAYLARIPEALREGIRGGHVPASVPVWPKASA